MAGISLFLIVITVVAHPVIANDQLKLVHILYRHGDRSPTKTFPGDPHADFWKKGLGQLTKIGMAQHYRLGQFFRQRYTNNTKLIPATYNASEIVVRSTDVDRTLMSAQANLAGWFPPPNNDQFKDGFPWQPIPVHTRPQAEDYELVTFASCPKAEKALKDKLASPEIQQEERENHEFYEFVSNKTGVPNEGIASIWEIYDTFLCEKDHNLTLPQWVTEKWNQTGETIFDKMQKLDATEFTLSSDGPVLRRLRGGPLLKEMIGHMQQYSEGKLKASPKVFVYSAHDTTVAALLATLGVYNGKLPPYAAAVMLELYQTAKGPAVKVVFRNDSVPTVEPQELHTLVINGCTPLCPLEKFRSLMKDVLPGDWHQECQLSPPSIFSRKFIIILSSVAGVVLLVVIATAALCYLRHKRRRYSSYWGLTTDATI